MEQVRGAHVSGMQERSMIRRELHTVRRPIYDCTTYRRPAAEPAPTLHVHAELTRPALPRPSIHYNDIKVALRLAA